MYMRIGFLVSISTLAFGASVQAQTAADQTAQGGPSQRFGEAGQLAVSSDAALVIDHTSIEGLSGGTTSVELAPAADYFPLRGVSFGGFVAFKYTKAGSEHATRFSVGPRVGYNWTLSDLLSLWPKAGFSYATTSGTIALPVSDTSNVGRASSGGSIALNFFVPLMFHPATHFFAGFGPFLDVDFAGDAKATVIGGKLTLGGWLD
jgi:hypothetical protein